mmetsp:Transcript_18036/g.53626  ORF Transcript_18036/g.53626 Transcript_18036/m.53626 type:complete len:102 (-) Transcript_18036:41-346(-)
MAQSKAPSAGGGPSQRVDAWRHQVSFVIFSVQAPMVFAALRRGASVALRAAHGALVSVLQNALTPPLWTRSSPALRLSRRATFSTRSCAAALPALDVCGKV